MIYNINNFPIEKAKGKKLISFDQDNTIIPSKTHLDDEMADLISKLLQRYKVDIISGVQFKVMEKGILNHLAEDENLLKNLYLSTLTGTVIYAYRDTGWTSIHTEILTPNQKNTIFEAFKCALEKVGHHPDKLYGEMIEDRESQITFSAYGQDAPLEVKRKYDPDYKKRERIVEYLEEMLEDFEIAIAGTTSIDITKRGVDKGYGLKLLSEILNISLDQMLFIGDSLFEGGNDIPVAEIGVDSVKVNGVNETKEFIKRLLSFST